MIMITTTTMMMMISSYYLLLLTCRILIFRYFSLFDRIHISEEPASCNTNTPARARENPREPARAGFSGLCQRKYTYADISCSVATDHVTPLQVRSCHIIIIIIITIYFENVYFYHAKLGSDVCPKYRAPPLSSIQCPLLSQSKQFHILPHTLSQSLSTPASYPHPHNLHASTG